MQHCTTSNRPSAMHIGEVLQGSISNVVIPLIPASLGPSHVLAHLVFGRHARSVAVFSHHHRKDRPRNAAMLRGSCMGYAGNKHPCRKLHDYLSMYYVIEVSRLVCICTRTRMYHVLYEAGSSSRPKDRAALLTVHPGRLSPSPCHLVSQC
jgi:hypothetical protein